MPRTRARTIVYQITREEGWASCSGCTVPCQTTPTITRRTGVLYTACASQAPEPQTAALTRRSSSTFTSHGSLKLPPLVRDGFESQDEDMRTILLPFSILRTRSDPDDTFFGAVRKFSRGVDYEIVAV